MSRPFKSSDFDIAWYEPTRFRDAVAADGELPPRENAIVHFECKKDRQVKTFICDDGGQIINKGYRSAFKARAREYYIRDLVDLHMFLQWAETNEKAVVLRGHPLITRKLVRRLIHDKEGYPRTFEDTPRLWLGIDIDDIQMPPGLGYDCPEDVAEYAVSLLPQQHFWDVSYIWQLSSSAGVTTQDVIKLHLWFWLDQPCTSAQLRGWAKPLNGLIDEALYNPVQPHITARPVFVGMEDPFPVRTGLVLRGKMMVTDADRLEAPPKPDRSTRKLRRQKRDSRHVRQQTSGAPGLDNEQMSSLSVKGSPFSGWPAILNDIQHEQHFHRHIWRLILSYFGRGGSDKEEVKAMLRVEVPACNTSNRGDVDDRYMTDAYLDEQIENAISKP